jgi:Domain of unknown function (DU1801)
MMYLEYLMAKAKKGNKTRPTGVSPAAFIQAITHPQRRADALELVQTMRAITGTSPRMWGPTIIGFDQVHYVYPTGREGDIPLAGFSPRKQALVIYLGPGIDNKALLAKLGKHKAGVGCLYINKLDDVDRAVLKKLIDNSVREMRRLYPASARPAVRPRSPRSGVRARR